MKKKATVFEFKGYNFDSRQKKIDFYYITHFENREKMNFKETIIFPQDMPDMSYNVYPSLAQKLFEGLHLIIGISYYKLHCAPKIELAKAGMQYFRPKAYQLTQKEADFWTTVYRKGLGEFFFVNNLDPKIFPGFPADKKAPNPDFYYLFKNKKCLVSVGGGKDSIVSAELLKGAGFEFSSFVVQNQNNSPTIDKITEIIGKPTIKIKRILDPQLKLENNYSGHIPISAIYAFLGITTAIFYGCTYFIVSNEYSSSFGNITYKGQEINHQWSKSYEFEKLFSEYVKEFLSPNVFYFSLLRSFYEIRIAKMFSKMKKYFPYFSSCNRNFSTSARKHQGLWCLECPKCVFVFIILSAFLTEKELLKIFGKNLYERESLLPLFKDIMGLGGVKPFDCVGTFQEAQTALVMAKKKFTDTFIMRQISNDATPADFVMKTQKDSRVIAPFIFLGMESVLILGYGKEGKETEKYLKKFHPKIKRGIADQNKGKDYLQKQNEFDMAIKTPGIPKEKITIPYTTATDIFFSTVDGKYLTIGITGSKGKSTTASLIAAILKRAGKKVQLAGNIGIPMLSALLKPIKKDTIFVLELSSYQLDDIHFSPNVAVLTNIFKDHIDYHGNFENYAAAKKNIINYNMDGFLIYNPKDPLQIKWAKQHRGKSIPYVKSIGLKKSEIPLSGKHNEENIRAAITATKKVWLLGIKDQTIKSAIKKFKPLEHRLEFVGTYKKIKFYNDANATIPEATISAIETLKKVDTIFLGGQDRKYDFSKLEKTIKKYKIRNVVLFPDSGPKIISSQKKLNLLFTNNMKEAVKFAYKYTKPNKICLLSCASPSYSLWKNFEEKGSQFKKFVKELNIENK